MGCFLPKYISDFYKLFILVLQDRNFSDISNNPFLQLTSAFFNSDPAILVNQSLSFCFLKFRILPCGL